MTVEVKRLYRSRNDRMVAGVCAGLAEYFDADPTLVRLLAGFMLVFGAPGILPAYIVMALIIPEAPAEKNVTSG
ncbi:MAG: PspC domain-containing protein [Anaerolineales bacterium]|nr:MAG: PspC domain-containing protein [Anaerolineales bacterium]